MRTSPSLFNMAELRHLSPYKEWERRNRIKTHFAPHCEESPWTAARTFKTVAEVAMQWGEDRLGEGMTRDEAIKSLCKKLNIQPYGQDRTKTNENQPTNPAGHSDLHGHQHQQRP